MDVNITLNSVFVSAGEMTPTEVQEHAEILKRFYSCNVHDMTVGTFIIFSADALSWSQKKLIVDTFHKFVENKIYLKSVKEREAFLSPLKKWVDFNETIVNWSSFAKFFNKFIVEERQILDLSIEIELPQEGSVY